MGILCNPRTERMPIAHGSTALGEPVKVSGDWTTVELGAAGMAVH